MSFSDENLSLFNVSSEASLFPEMGQEHKAWLSVYFGICHRAGSAGCQQPRAKAGRALQLRQTLQMAAEEHQRQSIPSCSWKLLEDFVGVVLQVVPRTPVARAGVWHLALRHGGGKRLWKKVDGFKVGGERPLVMSACYYVFRWHPLGVLLLLICKYWQRPWVWGVVSHET